MVGGAVTDAINSGLMSDCVTLLAARDTLAGTAALNWSTETPIADWSGVVVGGEPGRVQALNLSSNELTGEIPAELGNLSNLQTLNLSSQPVDGRDTGRVGKPL